MGHSFLARRYNELYVRVPQRMFVILGWFYLQIKVSNLDFHTYSSVNDLRAEEKLNMYPPHFKISINRLLLGKKFDTEFKITLENDGVLVSEEVRKFPLTITELSKRVMSGRYSRVSLQIVVAATLMIQCTYYQFVQICT